MDTATGQPILLHACCGPCSLEPTRLLQEDGFAPTILYANSNIWPYEEYRKRLDTLLTWANAEGIEVIEAPYNHDAWLAGMRERFGDGIASAGKARCAACYAGRLRAAADYAQQHGFDCISTTLSVSPYQYTDEIARTLAEAAQEDGIAAHFVDFRENYPEATRRSRELGMYRQNYCGCEFSYAEAAEERELHKAERKAAREAYLAEHADELAAAEEARLANRAEKQAYAQKQARKNELKRMYKDGYRG